MLHATSGKPCAWTAMGHRSCDGALTLAGKASCSCSPGTDHAVMPTPACTPVCMHGREAPACWSPRSCWYSSWMRILQGCQAKWHAIQVPPFSPSSLHSIAVSPDTREQSTGRTSLQRHQVPHTDGHQVGGHQGRGQVGQAGLPTAQGHVADSLGVGQRRHGGRHLQADPEHGLQARGRC